MTSERLGFGVWTQDDGGLAAAIWGDPEVTRLTGGPFAPWQVEARLASEISNGLNHGIQYWPLFRLDTHEHVGCCGLRPRASDDTVLEFGFQLRRASWGQGYASEAARAVIAWVATRGITALIAGHHPLNHASGAVLRRLGFTYTHDELYPRTGQMEPSYRLDIDSQPLKRG